MSKIRIDRRRYENARDFIDFLNSIPLEQLDLSEFGIKPSKEEIKKFYENDLVNTYFIGQHRTEFIEPDLSKTILNTLTILDNLEYKILNLDEEIDKDILEEITTTLIDLNDIIDNQNEGFNTIIEDDNLEIER